MRAARLASTLLLLPLPFLAGCDDDIYGIGRHDFEGVYSYAGTVDNELGDVVVGEIVITRQRGSRALVTLEWSYLDQGVEIVTISTDRPADAELWSDGRIRFDFEGDLFMDDDVVSFRLEHDGRLENGTLTGFWRLTTGLPTDDTGTFTASRQH